MVSFATLFFGLVFGVVDVEVRAPVAAERVELLLDGEKVAELRRPFAGAVDLGEEPVPGELVAIAYDASGRELGRASQQVNSPRADARARLSPEGEVRAGADRAGASPDRTAVPVVPDEGAALPGPDGLAGWFAKEGRPLKVAAVAEGGFDVVFVCEPSAFDELKRVFAKRAGPNTSTSDEDLRFRFLLPSGFPADDSEEPGMQEGRFAASKWFSRRWAAIGPTLSQGIELDEAFAAGQRLSDAVAVAGLAAAEGERRRAVVLLLGPAAKNESELPPAAAARFLAALRVPLHAWSVGRARSPEAESWDAETRVSNAGDLEAALSRLRRELRRQRIVWVKGVHLPQSVTLTPLAKGVRLAR